MDWSHISLLFLKPESKPTDDYLDHFTRLTNGTLNLHFVPVLNHVFHAQNISWLSSVIEGHGFSQDCDSDSTQAFSGIIFTSQRAVEAFSSIVKDLKTSQTDILLQNDLPLYAVGPATARGLRSLSLKCPILGEKSGNGANLADFILQNHASITGGTTPKRPLLFLVGEQRRDVIPTTLQSLDLPKADRIGVVEKVVYESQPLESMSVGLDEGITSAVDIGARRIWVVVFSPTGCKPLLEHVRSRADVSLVGPGQDTVTRESKPQVLIVTIGPTTKEYLQHECGFAPHACADEPSPRGIEKAIRAYDCLDD